MTDTKRKQRPRFYVICREYQIPGDPPGIYYLTRSRRPPLRSLAEARTWALTIDPSNEPRILKEVK